MRRKEGSTWFLALLEPWPNAVLLTIAYSGVLAAILGGLWVTLAYDRGEIRAAPLSYNMLTCEAVGSSATRPLRVYVFNHRQARRVLDALCDDPGLTSAFNGVEVVWQHERAEVFAALQGDFDVLVAAPDIVARAPLGPAVLAPIAGLADYDAVWLGQAADRPLDADTLGQLRIGLLSSPISMSGRVMPEVALRQSGIDVRALNIRMFRRHEEMRQALLDAEVDLIGTYWNERTDPERFGSFPRRAIGGTQGRNWYMERGLLDTALHCRVVEALEMAAAEQTDPYFQALEIFRPCRP